MSVRLSLSLGLALGFMMSVTPASGDEYDIVVRGVWAKPVPLTCSSSVCVRLLSVGDDDYKLQSGQCSVHFDYRSGEGDWISLGDVPVIWEAWEDGLVQNHFWPEDNVQSSTKNCLPLSPKSAGDYRFRAEVKCQGIADASPADNVLESISYSSAESCGLVVVPPCRVLSDGSRFNVICGEWPPPDPCRIHPDIPGVCGRPMYCDLAPELCGPIPFCKFSPMCGDPGPLEVLFDTRVNHLDVSIINRAGRVVEKTERLTTPITVGGGAYDQRIRFTVVAGESYGVTLMPGKGTKPNIALPFLILVRKDRLPR
jgi:hypothetical protein